MKLKFQILIFTLFLAVVLCQNESSDTNDTVPDGGSDNTNPSDGNGSDDSTNPSDGNGSDDNTNSSDGNGSDDTNTSGDGNNSSDGDSSTDGDSSSTFQDDVEASLKNLLGLNCMVEAVLNVEDNVGDFQYEVQLCGTELPLNVSFIVDDSEDIARITTKIIDDNDGICENAGYKEDEDASKALSAICAGNIERQMDILHVYTSNTVNEIANLAPTTACLTMAITNFQLSLGNLEKIVSTCGQLAGKV